MHIPRSRYDQRASAFIKDMTTSGLYKIEFIVKDSTGKVHDVVAPTIHVELQVCIKHDEFCSKHDELILH